MMDLPEKKSGLMSNVLRVSRGVSGVGREKEHMQHLNSWSSEIPDVPGACGLFMPLSFAHVCELRKPEGRLEAPWMYP